ncbi:MAG: hypothetical protein ACRC1K_24815, partial [Planctomycetia bacterium]
MAAILLFAVSTAGCKTCDLVEAELRDKTRRLEELEAKVLFRDAEINTLQETVSTLRSTPGVTATVPAETTYLRSAVSRVTLASSTGGRDADRDGRDDGVYVVLTPEDYDGDAV